MDEQKENSKQNINETLDKIDEFSRTPLGFIITVTIAVIISGWLFY